MKNISGVFPRRAIVIFLALLVFKGTARSQEWLRADVSDPNRGNYIGFTLQGKFLQAPSGMNERSPVINLHCREGHNSRGHFHGKFLEAVVDVGPPADISKPQGEARNESFSSKPDPGGYYVEFRLDDGEIQTKHWDNLFNYQQVGFGSKELNTILWGKASPAEENSTKPVKRLTISIQRYSTEKIVMQFEMPDPAKVSELCGCTHFK